MRKKVLSLFLAFILALNLLPAFSYSNAQSNLITSYRTSYNSDDYFEFSVSGETLTVKGKYSNSSINNIWVKLNDTDQGISNSNANELIIKTYSLAGFKTDASVKVQILLGKQAMGWFTSIFYGNDVSLKFNGSEWYFDINQQVLSINTEQRRKWLNPGSVLYTFKADKSIVELSGEITAGAKSNYEKLKKIHDWVVDNIYFDMDYYTRKVSTLSYDPVEVLSTKRAVSTGYANLTQAMCIAQNIPCILVYGNTISNYVTWTDEILNSDKITHVWNEAWADGRWVILDTTWDSGNIYNNATFDHKGLRFPVPKYFDPYPEQFSQNYVIVRFYNTDSRNIPSEWAQAEISKAFPLYLIPYNLQNNYRNNIKRSEFCSLMVSLIEVKKKTDIRSYLEQNKLSLNYRAFTDCSDPNVLAAYALGIVGGKGDGIFDPNGYITRQEAAVMMKRAAKILGLLNAVGPKQSFTDSGEFESWAADSIYFVSSIIDSASGRAVMGGTGNGRFSPNDSYTKEQSYCTVLRLYNAI